MKFYKRIKFSKNKRLLFLIGIITIIVLIGSIVRLYKLGVQPAGFFCDEAGLAYNAFLIGTTGKDDNGKTLPFYVNVFTPRGPVAIYDQIPAIKIFGLNEFGARFTSVLVGILSIISIFILAFLLFDRNILISIFSSFITAISPWHIQFSRFGTENIRFPFYFSVFLIFLLYGIKNEKHRHVLFSLLFFFLAFYSYTPANIFLPAFIAGTLLIYRNYFIKFKKISFLFLTTLIIIAIPFLSQEYNNSQDSRFSQVSVFNNSTTNQAIGKMTTTYLQSYSLNFLFLKGDIDMPNHFITRFSVRGVGEFYPALIPFFFVGIFFLLRGWKTKEYQLILLWLLLYPIGSVVAGADGGGPFATRSIIGVLVFPLVISLGIYKFTTFFKDKNFQKILSVGIYALLMVSFLGYLQLYFVEYPKYSLDFWGWQYGPRETIAYFLENQNKYDEMYLSPDFNAPDIFPKFYTQGKCNKCLVGLPNENYNVSEKQLFSVTPAYLEQNNVKMDVKKILYYPNGAVAFKIGEIIK